MTHLLIPERFNGSHSANGGWFAGSVAQRVHAATGAAEGTAVRVRLMAPPPLERPLTLQAHGEHFSIEDGATQIASAALAADLTASPQAPVSYAEAQAVATAYGGLSEHPFPTCFSCGPARDDRSRPAAGPAARAQWHVCRGVGPHRDIRPDRLGRPRLPRGLVRRHRGPLDGARDDDRAGPPPTRGGGTLRDHGVAPRRAGPPVRLHHGADRCGW